MSLEVIEAQDLIKRSLNYQDTPTSTPRIANDLEFNSLIYGTSRFQNGPEAQSWYSQVGDKLLSVIRRG